MSNANPRALVEFLFPRVPNSSICSDQVESGPQKPSLQREDRQVRVAKYIQFIYTFVSGGAFVTRAKVFKSGNSQAVRLPKEFRFRVKEVEILRRGDEIVLREPRRSLARAFELLTSMPEDFFADGRKDEPPQEREDL
jgi:antitoxin VapB